MKAYNSERHYMDYLYMARRWTTRWGKLPCAEITRDMIERFVLDRSKVSRHVANKEVRYLRATFNFGVKRGWLEHNPTIGIEFMPVEKRLKYVPSPEDIDKVIAAADPDTQDYLWTLVFTAARVNEVNALTWEDVDFERRTVTLWTRKRRHGNREPRNVPMVQSLCDILERRFAQRDPDKPWVFWHSYYSRKAGTYVQGPYKDRKKIMGKLCAQAEVPYFRFHAFRHLTASMLDDMGVSIGVIQRILGHQNRRTTEIYLQSVGESERLAMTRLEEQSFGDLSSTLKDGPTNMHREFWQRKVERPSYEVLKREVAELGYVQTGKKYGVSNNAVKKWLQQYEKASGTRGHLRVAKPGG